MLRIAVVGSGKIGEMICNFLIDSGDYHVTLIDASEKQLDIIPDCPGLSKHCLDVTDVISLEKILLGHFAILCAGPYYLTVPVACSAALAKIHYLDLTEDIASACAVKALAENASTAFIPQCGLAPGLFPSLLTISRNILTSWIRSDYVSVPYRNTRPTHSPTT